MKRAAVLLALALAGCGAAPPAASPRPDLALAQAAVPSLVRFSAAVGEYGVICAGTYVTADLILTAAHCVDDGVPTYVGAERDPEHPRWYLTAYATRRLVLYSKADVAVIQVLRGTHRHPVLAIGDWPELGEDVWAVGHPAGEWEDTVTRGTVSYVPRYEGGALWIQSDVPVWFGNSGGPLLNARGEIVGVASHGIPPVHVMFAGPPYLKAALIAAIAEAPWG